MPGSRAVHGAEDVTIDLKRSTYPFKPSPIS
jgi:hypothetical protein